jgi:hypothetical protein
MKRAFFFVLLLATSASGKYFDRCGVNFSYPDTWTAKLNPKDDVYLMGYEKGQVRCAIGLRPPGWIRENDASAVDLGKWALIIVVIDRPFLEAAKNAGFTKSEDERLPDGTLPRGLVPGGWGILVRQGVNPARQFQTSCCDGLRGSSWSHSPARDGSVATTSSEEVVLNDRHGHSAIIGAAEDERFSAVITRIVKHFRFAR